MKGAFLGTLLAAAFLAGCSPGSADPDAAAVYRSIDEDVLHSRLDVALVRAGQARQTAARKEPDWETRFALQEAEILLRQGRTQDALALLGQLRPRVRAGTELAIRLDWLSGFTHLQLRQLEEARGELAEAHRLADATHSGLLAEILRSEALLEKASGNPEGTLPKLRSSLAAIAEAHEPHAQLLRASDLVDIGYEELLRGRYDPALAASQQAADYARSVEAPRPLQAALGNVGWAYLNLGDLELAHDSFVAAERGADDLGLTPSRIRWLQNAGRADYGLADLARTDPERDQYLGWAVSYEEQALQLTQSLPEAAGHALLPNIEASLAILLHRQGRDTEAGKHAAAAAQAAAGARDSDILAYVRFAQGLLAPAPQDTQLLTSAHQLAQDLDLRMQVESALARLYAARGLLLEADQWYRWAIGTFERELNELHVADEPRRLVVFSYDDRVYREYARFLLNSHRGKEALAVLDRSRARALGGDPAPEKEEQSRGDQDARAVARSRDALILFYWLEPKTSYLWAITANDTQLFELPGRELLANWVEQHQRAVNGGGGPPRDLEDAPSPADAHLYEALIKPVTPLIPASGRVLIVPDQELHGLSFDTLLVSATGGRRYWIRQVTASTASAIWLLQRSDATAAVPRRELLIIGDPLPVSDKSMPPPPSTAAEEIGNVVRHFTPGAAFVLRREGAVPAAYGRSDPGQFRYIHITAHGIRGSPRSPLDSFVLLSAPPNDPQGFKLYARDMLLPYPLSASLVVVSSCGGSGTKSYGGTLVGLAWALLRGGAHNVIAALWDTNAKTTPPLMERLYSELQADHDPATALRAAKLELLGRHDTLHLPYYWAAFQLYTGSPAGN